MILIIVCDGNILAAPIAALVLEACLYFIKTNRNSLEPCKIMLEGTCFALCKSCH